MRTRSALARGDMLVAGVPDEVLDVVAEGGKAFAADGILRGIVKRRRQADGGADDAAVSGFSFHNHTF